MKLSSLFAAVCACSLLVATPVFAGEGRGGRGVDPRPAKGNDVRGHNPQGPKKGGGECEAPARKREKAEGRDEKCDDQRDEFRERRREKREEIRHRREEFRKKHPGGKGDGCDCECKPEGKERPGAGDRPKKPRPEGGEGRKHPKKPDPQPEHGKDNEHGHRPGRL